MSTETISNLVGSSQCHAVTSDSLKDDDNAAWVLWVDLPARLEWIERMSWVRLVDRLAESELVDGHDTGFQVFRKSWKHLLSTGQVRPEGDYQGILTKVHSRWFQGSQWDIASIQAWDRYVDAIAVYHQPGLTIATLNEHEDMLQRLAGSFSQVLPYLPTAYRDAIFHFGALDQFYNNLRDLAEDASRGICYLPTGLLQQYGLTRQNILTADCCHTLGYQRFMQFWLDEYLPCLRQQVRELVVAHDLPPSWKLLRDWSLQRYDRIERVFRQCEYDYVEFPKIYWAEVRHYLGKT
ncbi:MAG: squalene/phytoene synthase family protein [Cyanobacteria bacterium]|nr:squalene/phytoene synthase family protein [Cyanobacteriota bacterium]MDW8200790.1 squalene/phytoene synthase family protein [Cyanobacteriota bacterium SKYGB_h_bin112]